MSIYSKIKSRNYESIGYDNSQTNLVYSGSISSIKLRNHIKLINHDNDQDVLGYSGSTGYLASDDSTET